MTSLVSRCGLWYRRVARAFPYEHRVIYGDGLEQLGEDVVPIVWRDEGVVGLLCLFGDLALQLPVAYVSVAVGRFKELTMASDPFEGTWQANPERSSFDPKYTPEQACIRFEPTESGYLMIAYGIKDGQACAERPTPIIPDGKRRPIVDLNGRPIPGVPAGAVCFGSRLDSRTIESGAEVDGKSLGKGTYAISEDGSTLTVTTEGMGLKGPFKMTAVFDRVVPDPYLPNAQ